MFDNFDVFWRGQMTPKRKIFDNPFRRISGDMDLHVMTKFDDNQSSES